MQAGAERIEWSTDLYTCGVRLAVETALARAAGRASRLVGGGGGTTLPGKLLTKVDPGAVGRLAGELPQGSVLLSATNGKTTTAAMAAGILSPDYRLAHNATGANLVSGVATALATARGAHMGLFEVDEAALPEIARAIPPRVLCLGNLFRDQLDRYGELEIVAERWRAAVAALPEEATLIVNADDPLVADLARAHERSRTFGIDDPRHAGPTLQHAADSKYCLRCGTPFTYAAAYAGHLGDYSCPSCGQARPALDVAGRAIEPRGLDGIDFTLAVDGEERRVCLQVPGIHNVYNALAAATVAHAVGAGLDGIVRGLGATAPAFGRFERIAVGDRALRVLLIKNPAGANETLRTLLAAGGTRVAVVALNDEIADGRDVSWIWDVDFEPFAAGLTHLVASGGRASELALRFAYGGLARDAIEVVPDLGAALDRGLALTEAGGELAFLPTYTAMLGLQAIVADRGYAKKYWERVA